MIAFGTSTLLRTVSLTTLAGAALLFAAPALAQDATGQEIPGPDADTAADEALPGDIVVTAQKREENLQEIPLAISVVGGDQIAAQGGVNIENAQYLVPSLNFRKAGTSLNQALFLRGVGTINFSIAAEPSVAAVLDGVVLSRAGEGFGDLIDVERIEVLRGPQGTLFGKNASAGVISIVTKAPDNDFGASVQASYFDEEEYRAQATLNLPLTDTARSRFSAFYSEYDGNIRNITTGTMVNGYKHYGFRGVVELDLSDDVTATFRGDWRKADDDCCAEVIATTPTNVAAAALTGTNIRGDRTRAVAQNLVTRTEEESWGASLQLDADVALGTITSITAYRVWDNNEIRDGDFLPGLFVGLNQLHDLGPQSSDTFSQELRLASPGGDFIDYVVGAYYSRADSDRTFSRETLTCTASTLPAQAPGLIPCAAGSSTINRFFGSADFGSVFTNLSFFGQATVNVSDAFRVVGGLRYTLDQLDVDLTRVVTAAGPGIQPNFGPFSTGTDETNLSGKAAIQYDLNDDIMAYVSYTRGYKGPAYNIFFNLTQVGTNVIEAETVDAFEAGLKNSLFGGELVLNLAAYYAKYENYQANNPDLVAGVVVTRLTNAGDVSTKGAELDFIWQPSRVFSLSGGVAYTDAQVDQFRLPPGGNPAQLIPSGTPLANAPKWKAALGGEYTFEAGFADIVLGAQGSYQSSQLYQLDPNPVTRAATTVDGYGIVDLSASLVDVNNAWKLTAQVKNVFDTSFAASIVTGGPGGSLRYIIPREADRYFGITARLNFGGER